MSKKVKRNLAYFYDQKLKPQVKSRRCNLCEKKFTQRTVFDRYCYTCKVESDLLKFSDWLPEVGETAQEKISA
jgi:hypothetical protein